MLRGAIIGFGRMGITHFAILNSHPDVQIAAVGDVSGFVLRHLRKQLQVATFSSYEELLDTVPLDFAVVSTPTSSHEEVVSQAIRRGLHVFVEKPLSLEPARGAGLIEAARQARVVNQVGYVNRFNEVFAEVKRLLEAGALGEIYHFRCSMNAPTVLRRPRGGWRNRRSEGGGCLHDFASHGIDLIHHLVGVPDRVCGSALKSIYSEETEDAVYASLAYRRGLNGYVAVNWSDGSCRKPAYRMEIEGSGGRIVADQHACKLYLTRPWPAEGLRAGWSVRYATDLNAPVRFYLRGNEFTRQLDYFVSKVLAHDLENINSFASALAADRVIQAIFDDSRQMKGIEPWTESYSATTSSSA